MIKTVDVLIATVAAGVLLAACGTPEEDRPRPATSAAASASHDDDRSAAVAQYADRNRDGRVTRDEAGADPKLLAEFERYDTNDDDALDRGEFARLEAKAIEQHSEVSRPTMRPRGEYAPN
jgi:hypothetical protein